MKNLTSDPVLETIRQTEHKKRNILFRFFTRSEIYTATRFPELWYPGKIDKSINHIEFRRSRIVPVIPVLALIFFIVFFYRIPRPDGFFMLPFWVLLMSGPVIGIFFWSKRAFGKDSNFDIYIDDQHLTIGNTRYKWDDVYETAIIIYGPNNKNSSTFLIVILNDMSYQSYSLSNFSVFRPIHFTEKLARHLTFFKSRHNETI